MNLSQLLALADGWHTLAQAENALSRGLRAVEIEGTPLSAKGWMLARLAQDLGAERAGCLLVVTYAEDQAARIAEDLERFLPADRVVRRLPSSLPLLLDDEDAMRDVGRAGRRIATLLALVNNEPTAAIVTTASALLQRTPPPATIKNRRLTLRVGDAVNPDSLAVRLNALGYNREDQVYFPGSFSRRGDILDVFPSDAEQPVRIDFFGDEVETIRTFDRETQRSEGKQDSVTVVAAHEVIFTRESIARAADELEKHARQRLAEMKSRGETPERIERLQDSAEGDIQRIRQASYFAGIERYLSYLHPDAVCALDYLPENCLFVADEPAQISSHTDRELNQILKNLEGRAERGEILPVSEPPCVEYDEGMRRAASNRQTLLLSLLPRSLSWISPQADFQTHGAAVDSFGSRSAAITDALATYRQNKVKVVIVSAQAPRVRGLMSEKNIPEVSLPAVVKDGGITLVNGVLRSGFKLTDHKLVVLSDAELFSAPIARKRVRKREFREGMRLTSLLDLKEGDYVVHIHHGIGVYRGLTRMTVQGIQREYMLIQYEGADKLYVPVDQIDRVQKYIGSEGGSPQVNKLGGTDWAKTTARAKRQVREIAEDLVKLYAARQATPGHAYGEDTPWQREMEDAFPYIETPDQEQAIQEVKTDLEAPRPMDRLICGDVGFGKTEVAMRAAFKVASEGRQVAVLCPTTVLCAQHYATFSERFSAFPVRVDQLSRFRTAKQQAQTVADVKAGNVDIVIGTHRLLSKDIEFKDLGLVIVDEEQRFGVTHKERLKQLRQTVDVLAMSATPIPRTLQMSLSGIRDMSLINDPPEGRTPVKTLIKEYDDQLVQEAIQRELDRGGQVYFLHNRVESIYHVAGHLEKIVPNARFRVAHGQMPEDELEETMLDFYERKFDVLVCTTIIESGLDIPNVNTILIDNADKLGLSQLYQLRGRVGRSRIQAYAMLLYKRNKVLSTVAEQRLGALREFSELGSGYKVALRDLELRGAGNLLGAQQHGTVSEVGFDLYMQLLEEAVREMRNDKPRPETEPLPLVDLPVAAVIPEVYVPGEAQRILMYKKLSAVRTRDDANRLQEEFEDRFGDPPAPVWNALGLLRLRIRCREVGIESIQAEGKKITIVLQKGKRLPVHTLKLLNTAFKSQGHTFAQDKVVMTIQSSKVLPAVEEMVEVISKALDEPPPAPKPPARPGERSTRRSTATR
ncbi:MAG: transcription-repair coupling factor [Armatimonadaceae bacterium]